MEHWQVLENLAAEAEAERGGWRTAVLALLSDYPALLRYVGDERSGDWRFLLPELPGGDVLCVGGALSPVPLSLARTATSVSVQCGSLQGRFLQARARQEGFPGIRAIRAEETVRQYGVVAVLRSPLKSGAWRNRNLTELVEKVEPGGWLYLEVDSLSISAPPLLLKWMLRRAGLSEVAFYWPKPTFQHCEMLMPMGDRDVQNYYLDYQFFAMSAARRALRSVLKLSTRLGVFDLTVPAYSVLARRAGGETD